MRAFSSSQVLQQTGSKYCLNNKNFGNLNPKHQKNKMKKALLASILGVVASVATTFGQGQVYFNNYANNGYAGAPVKYGANSGGTIDSSVAGGFNSQLAYVFGTVADVAGNDDISGFTLLGTILPNLGGTGLPGMTAGPIVTIPGYLSGPITFQWLAFNGADYAGSDVRGHSAAFTLPSIATGQTLPGYLDGMASFAVSQVPEPSTFALAGLGSAAMLIFRRRK